MKLYNKSKSAIAAVALLFFAATSCTDLLNPEAEDVLSTTEVYRNLDDANSTLRGIYGKLMDCAPQYVVLNELRADLMDVTSNADQSLMELSWHQSVSDDNKWADPTPFFSLINTCNNAVVNFENMYNENKINREDFNIRYSEALAVRSWAYLQVALHFSDREKGGVPYFTKPLDNIDDIELSSINNVPYLNLETMIDSLVTTMATLPYKTKITDESLITTISTYNSNYMYIDKEYLLGELYLWDENYYMAASTFKNIMERSTTEDINNPYDRYKIPFDASATLSVSSSRYNSGYSRYYENDRFSIRNNWPYMFFDIETTNYYNEWLWVLYFDQLNEPSPFIDLFAKEGGEYLLKPSRVAIENWDNQVQQNSFKGDFRGYFYKPNGFNWVNSDGQEYTVLDYVSLFGLPGSYDIVNGDPVVMKYIYDYSKYNQNFDLLDKSGRWFLWRSATMHLRYCEAANRDGQHKVAYALLNNGIRANYPGSDPDAADNDYTHRHQTELPFPYDFDARSTGSGDIPPGLRQPWFRNTGIRNRVSLNNYQVESDSLSTIEMQILKESALELAFEGQRWGDLVRIAIHNGDNSILADRVAEKLNRAGMDGEAVRIKLQDRNNWFLPL
jgi:hypothetical protein